jgi:hypothetical protein
VTTVQGLDEPCRVFRIKLPQKNITSIDPDVLKKAAQALIAHLVQKLKTHRGRIRADRASGAACFD